MPDSAVVDDADLVPAQAEAALERKLRSYHADSGTAIVVQTVHSLQGETIEKLANRIFNTWGIGDAETDRGLLILIAHNEREVRIEVGHGLGCVITGPVAKQIIDRDMIPRFRTGDFAGAADAGVDGLIRGVAAGPVDEPIFPSCQPQTEKAA